jgi:hypothetical protein
LVLYAAVLGYEAMKPSWLTYHHSTKHSIPDNKPNEFFMSKRDAHKIENTIISQASTADSSLLTASYSISLEIAICKKLYSISQENIKLCFTVACNEVLRSVCGK